ncbi:MAG TPA: type III pantothenate kinase [Xanthomonadales bacterium]|nr:type III pantothenate kinase [Xanthomonadales bacterium]
MTALLLDAGNTRVKWALADGASFVRTGAVAHGDTGWADALAPAWGAMEPSSIWLASVAASDITAALCAVLDARFPRTPLQLVRSAAALGGVRSGYADPARLGVDRLLALAGANAGGFARAVVVGVGTAATIDALADGEHRGGLILPSPDAMQAAVVAGTQVRPGHAGRVAAFGRSTEDALASGAWIALAAAVERSAATLARELGSDAAIVLHGGGAPTLARVLERPAELRELLVLEGLAAVAREAVG